MKLKNLLIPAILLMLIIGGVYTAKLLKEEDGKGSVPVSTTNTNDYSVDVCVNQECDYVADGQNDEREIKLAITAVLGAGGGTVNIRNGSYNISSPINVTLSGKSLIIKGDGHNTQLTNSMTDSSANGSTFVITGSSGSSADYFGVRDIYLIGGSTSGSGVVTNNVATVEILSSKFYNFSASGDYGAAIKTVGATNLITVGNLFTSNTKNTLIDSGSTNLTILDKNTDPIRIPLDTPTDGAAATSTAGSLDADTYYFKITTIDGAGGESLPSTEFTCAVGSEMSGTSSQCNLTWTDTTGEYKTRIWVATTSDTYYGYFTATTSGAYYLATSTGLTSGTISAETTAYVNNFATSSDSWIMSGQVGIGTTTPVTELDVAGLVRTRQTSTTTCSGTIQGAIFYNPGNDKFWGCASGGWEVLN